MSENIEKTINITFNGEDRELSMSFGLLTELSNGLGDIYDLQTAVTDPQKSIDLVNITLHERDAKGKVKTEIDVREGDLIDPETYEQILTWVFGHCMSFFVRRSRAFAGSTKNLGAELQELQALGKDANGLLDSNS